MQALLVELPALPAGPGRLGRMSWRLWAAIRCVVEAQLLRSTESLLLSRLSWRAAGLVAEEADRISAQQQTEAIMAEVHRREEQAGSEAEGGESEHWGVSGPYDSSAYYSSESCQTAAESDLE